MLGIIPNDIIISDNFSFNALVKIVSKFVPLGVINAILSLVGEIFGIFCAKTPMWLGLVQSALNDVVNFANQMASFAINKVIQVVNKAISDAVRAVTCRILNGITSAMERIKGVAGDVIAAVNIAKAAAGAARGEGQPRQIWMPTRPHARSSS